MSTALAASASPASAVAGTPTLLFFAQQDIDHLYGRYLVSAVVGVPTTTTADPAEAERLARRALLRHFPSEDVLAAAERLNNALADDECGDDECGDDEDARDGATLAGDDADAAGTVAGEAGDLADGDWGQYDAPSADDDAPACFEDRLVLTALGAGAVPDGVGINKAGHRVLAGGVLLLAASTGADFDV